MCSSKKSSPFLLFLLLFIFNTSINARENQQYGTVTGFVYDKQTGEPIENVSVFLNNTTRGDASNKTGNYVIPKVLPGRYTLVASMMGFETQKTTINVLAGKTVTHDFKLDTKIFKYKPLEVTGKEAKQWKKDLKRFKELFIGLSKFARQCEIQNPEIIDFGRRPDRAFTASANIPLKLINKALGYDIEFSLEFFIVTETELKYSGETRFVELVPKDEKEQDKWRNNRLKAYAGSMRHFLTTVISGRSTDDEDFSVFALSECPNFIILGDQKPRSSIKPEIQIESGFQPYEKRLSFRGCLQIQYNKERAETGYLYSISGQDASKLRSIVQTSWAELIDPSVSVDIRGNLLYRDVIKKYGYWAWERFGDLLPMDYVPEIEW